MHYMFFFVLLHKFNVDLFLMFDNIQLLKRIIGAAIKIIILNDSASPKMAFKCAHAGSIKTRIIIMLITYEHNDPNFLGLGLFALI